MKILLVQESDWLTKGPHQQHHLMDRLSLKSHEIRVIDFEIAWKTQRRRERISRRKIFSEVSKIYKEAKVTLIRPRIVKIPVLDMVSMIFSHLKEINRQIKEFRPDVIVGFGILNNYLAIKMAKMNGIPFVYYLIDELHTLVPYRLFQSFAKVMVSKILQGADRVMVINDELKDFAVRLGADPKRIHIIRAGVDSDSFNPNIKGASIRKQYGMEMTDLVLFFMGTVFSFSGLKEVALDLARVKREYPNMKLLIVGQARTLELQNELQEIREKNSLQNHLILTGRQPYEKIPSFVAASDICLLPAYNNEVMRSIVPMKMYEYMVSGKPVISTKLPGIIREFGYGNGVIYVNRPTGVIKKVIELTSKGENFAELGSQARSFVERYSWDDITEEFERILEKTLQNDFTWAKS